MSELRADTITASDGTSPVTLTKQSAAKAWVNVDGTGTVSLRDSFNSTSLVDNGTGDYSHSFVSSMANVNHASSGINNPSFAGTFNRSISLIQVASASSISYKSAKISTSTAEDQESLQVITHGDLA